MVPSGSQIWPRARRNICKIFWSMQMPQCKAVRLAKLPLCRAVSRVGLCGSPRRAAWGQIFCKTKDFDRNFTTAQLKFCYQPRSVLLMMAESDACHNGSFHGFAASDSLCQGHLIACGKATSKSYLAINQREKSKDEWGRAGLSNPHTLLQAATQTTPLTCTRNRSSTCFGQTCDLLQAHI